MVNSTLFLQFFPSRVLGLIAEPGGSAYRFRKAFRLSLENSKAGKPETAPACLLRGELHQFKHNAPRKCVLVLHRQDLAVLALELPPGTDAETALMLELDLRERLPLDMDQVCYGWEITGANQAGLNTILVYWTAQDRIAPMLDVLREANLELVGVFPAPAVHRPLLRDESDSRSFLLAHFAPEGFDLTCWEEGGSILFSRGRLSKSGTEKEDEKAALLSEFTSSVHACEQRVGNLQGVRTIYLGTACAAEALRTAGSGQNTEPPAEKRITDLLARIEEGDGVSFLSLACATERAGSLLRGTKGNVSSSSLNMMPKLLRLSKEGAFLRRQVLKAVFLVLSILILAAGNIWLYCFEMEYQLKVNKEQISRLTPAAKEVDAMEERIRTIRDQIDYVLSPADALREINTLLADHSTDLEGLFLDHMTYKDTGHITMEGHVTNEITPWRFAEKLDTSGLFRIADKPQLEIHPVGEARLIRFSLSVDVSKEQSPASTQREVGK